MKEFETEQQLMRASQRALDLQKARLQTAEMQIVRLLDLQEQMRVRLDKAHAELNNALTVILDKDRELGMMAGELADARNWARVWKMAASKWFGTLGAPMP